MTHQILKIEKNSKYIKNTCVYVGSFYKGKGFETILKISKNIAQG